MVPTPPRSPLFYCQIFSHPTASVYLKTFPLQHFNPLFFFSSSLNSIKFHQRISISCVNHSVMLHQEQQQQTSSFAANSLPSSSERSSSSALQLEIKDGMESDEEIRRVPELGSEGAGASISGLEGGPDRVQASTASAQKKRGRSPADKENKRLKRLLRNRVSAQQARERKKAYLNDLEMKVKVLEKKNTELDERLSTLQNENQMLRHILKNTTASRRGGSSATGE